MNFELKIDINYKITIINLVLFSQLKYLLNNYLKLKSIAKNDKENQIRLSSPVDFKNQIDCVNPVDLTKSGSHAQWIQPNPAATSSGLRQIQPLHPVDFPKSSGFSQWIGPNPIFTHSGLPIYQSRNPL